MNTESKIKEFSNFINSGTFNQGSQRGIHGDSSVGLNWRINNDSDESSGYKCEVESTQEAEIIIRAVTDPSWEFTTEELLENVNLEKGKSIFLHVYKVL